jgi:hypothetical protein
MHFSDALCSVYCATDEGSDQSKRTSNSIRPPVMQRGPPLDGEMDETVIEAKLWAIWLRQMSNFDRIRDDEAGRLWSEPRSKVNMASIGSAARPESLSKDGPFRMGERSGWSRELVWKMIDWRWNKIIVWFVDHSRPESPMDRVSIFVRPQSLLERNRTGLEFYEIAPFRRQRGKWEFCGFAGRGKN